MSSPTHINVFSFNPELGTAYAQLAPTGTTHVVVAQTADHQGKINKEALYMGRDVANAVGEVLDDVKVSGKDLGCAGVLINATFFVYFIKRG